MSKTRASCFITGSKHLETDAFICFSVFGTRDEALALVFDILLEKRQIGFTTIRVFLAAR